jgi:arginine N-succinyltransferase
MPVHPIYIPLLPQDAQDVIGEVHENTRPARAMLESEGFGFYQMIDIFEAGPILHCPRHMIRAVRQSRLRKVTEIAERVDSEDRRLIGNTSADFRVTQCQLEKVSGGIRIDRATADVLQVGEGDRVRYVSPKAK